MIPNIYVPINVCTINSVPGTGYRKIEWLLFEGKKKSNIYSNKYFSFKSFEETSEGKKIRSERSFPPLIF